MLLSNSVTIGGIGVGALHGAWPDIFKECKRVADEICKGPAGSLGDQHQHHITIS